MFIKDQSINQYICSALSTIRTTAHFTESDPPGLLRNIEPSDFFWKKRSNAPVASQWAADSTHGKRPDTKLSSRSL